MTAPDKVYSIWLMTSIKEHAVIGEEGGGRLIIKQSKSSDTVYYATWDGEKYRSKGGVWSFFATWEAAHTAAIAICQKRIADAKKEIASNERAIKKLEGMKE
jgi:hypothetical protein